MSHAPKPVLVWEGNHRAYVCDRCGTSLNFDVARGWRHWPHPAWRQPPGFSPHRRAVA